MSYSITPEQRVLKNGEDVGYISEGICFTNDPPKGRGIASFRAMAGNAELKFQPLPTVKDDLTVQPLPVETETTSEAETITETIQPKAPAIPEPPRSSLLGDRDPNWQRWFIATHGEQAFKAKWPNRNLP